MTIQCFAVANVPSNTDITRMAISSLVPNGGGLVESPDFTVTQTSPTSMGVLVSAGRAWIPGTNVANVSGKKWGDQGMYFLTNDAPYTVSLAASDPTNPRIDVIYVAVQDAAYTGTNNQPVIAVATGVPVSGAAYPANAAGIPVNALAVAWVYVAANASVVLNSNITDLAASAIGPTGWRPLTTTFNNSGLANLSSTGSRLVGDMGFAAGIYDRMMRVNANTQVTAASISSGVSQIQVCTSVMQSTAGAAQGKAALSFVAPGGYPLSAYATTGWILVPAGTLPLARFWIQVTGGTINTTVSNDASLTQFWTEEYPTGI